MEKKKSKKRYTYYLDKKVTLLVFFTNAIVSCIVGLVIWALTYTEIYAFLSFLIVSIILLSLSVLTTSIVLGFIVKNLLSGIKVLGEAMEKASQGDFSCKVNIQGPSELKYLGETFNQMLDDLSSIEMLKNDFISNFSHEFKTPLSSIKGFVNLINKGNITKDEEKKYLTIISTEIERISSLANSTLLLSKLNTETKVSSLQTVKVDEAVREAIILLAKNLEDKNIVLITDLQSVNIKTNHDYLKQIMINLISNAIKFTEKDGEIVINTYKEDDNAKIMIKDNGIGMSEETKKKIFDNYYQGDTSHSKEGYGLGLSIVKRIISLLEGNIEVDSTLNEGSTFIITLPSLES